MPVRVHVDKVLADRGMTLTELSEETGKARAVRFSTLGALCEALDCQPGDLLTYE
jgi:putative transcriptional regulator